MNARASHYSTPWCTRAYTRRLCARETPSSNRSSTHDTSSSVQLPPTDGRTDGRDSLLFQQRLEEELRSFCPLARAREYSFFRRIDSTHATTSFTTHATTLFFDPVRLFFFFSLPRFYYGFMTNNRRKNTERTDGWNDLI